MSMLTETVREVTAIRQQLVDEEARINGYLTTNQRQMQLVLEAMQGSQNAHDTRMLTALQQAEDSLKKARREIQQALTALLRVSTI